MKHFGVNTPPHSFKNFLERAELDGWISSYNWNSADSFAKLKNSLPKERSEGVSRTHKKGTDGIWWSLEVEADMGTSVGVDLELLIERPVLDKPRWIIDFLGISKNVTPKDIIEEWAHREAVFKSLYPNNTGIHISQIRRTAPHSYTVLNSAEERIIQTRGAWWNRWYCALAWRTS